MYEYRTETHYGSILPNPLVPPEPNFRLRDFRPVTITENENHTVTDRFNSFSGPALSGNINIPYTTSLTRNKITQWVIVWERYTEGEV